MKRSNMAVLVAIAALAFMAAGNLVEAAGPAPTPDKFTFWLEPATLDIAQNQTGIVTAYLKSEQGEMQGWSFGVCTQDQTVATAVDATWAGTDAATVNGGGKPGFESVSTYPGGVTFGAVIDMAQVNVLLPTARFSMLKTTYRMEKAPTASTRIEYCSILGDPPVDAVVVIGGQSITPATLTGALLRAKEGGGPMTVPTITLTPAEQNLTADKQAQASVLVHLGLTADSTATVQAEGWSYAVAHDASKLAIVSIEGSPTTLASNGGAAPDFYATNINPAGGAGGTVGCVISLDPQFNMLAIAPGQKVHTETFKYKSAIEIPEGGQPVTTELRMVHETLGDPPVASVLVVDSDGLLLTEDGRAKIVLQPAGGRLRPFVRGDANNDNTVNIADGVWILSWVYRNGREPPCKDAADANDDGMVDQADAILVVYYQLKNGSTPKPPFPGCGTDPSDTDSDDPEDDLTCEAIGLGCQ